MGDNDKTPLYDDKRGAPSQSSPAANYGTVGEMEIEEDIPWNNLTRRKLVTGVGLCVLFTVSILLATVSVIRLGDPATSTPTLQIIVMAYCVQLAMVTPFALVFFREFRADTKSSFCWYMSAGLMLGLAVLCGYQGAVILPGKVVFSLFPAAVLFLSVIYLWCTECEPDWVFGAICAASIAGLLCISGHGIATSYTYGWRPVIAAKSVGSIDRREEQESDAGAKVNAITEETSGEDVPEGFDDGAAGSGGPAPDDLSPNEHILYAYCTLLLGAFLVTLGASLVHQRLHHLHPAPYLFWVTLVGAVLAVIECLMFITPVWPETEGILPLIGAVVFLDIAMVSATCAWKFIDSALFMIVASFNVVILFALQYTSPDYFSILGSGLSIGIAEVVGLVLVVIGCVAGPVWIYKKVVQSESKDPEK